LLLLDEPTNHLDLDMRDALTVALEEYTGAMVLVSHDRSLIRATADELWLVADGTATPFDGDLEDYKAWVEQRRARDETPAKPSAAKPRRETPVKKKALLSKQAKLEAELHQAQESLSEIQLRLVDPATYSNPNDPVISELNHQREELEHRIARLEESWLELEMAIDDTN
jgi:ATP-binding cassette subfamily F protein 3